MRKQVDALFLLFLLGYVKAQVINPKPAISKWEFPKIGDPNMVP